MQDLVEHLTKFTGSTACYIGKLAKPIKKVGGTGALGINEEDDEDAHIINGAKFEIQFKHTSENHKFLVDEVLS